MRGEGLTFVVGAFPAADDQEHDADDQDHDDGGRNHRDDDDVVVAQLGQ